MPSFVLQGVFLLSGENFTSVGTKVDKNNTFPCVRSTDHAFGYQMHAAGTDIIISSRYNITKIPLNNFTYPPTDAGLFPYHTKVTTFALWDKEREYITEFEGRYLHIYRRPTVVNGTSPYSYSVVDLSSDLSNIRAEISGFENTQFLQFEVF